MTTLYLVAYDLPDDKRRTRLFKLLCGFGNHTQYSFFECFLNEKELVELRARVEKIVDKTEDNVRIYHICQSCGQKVETIGSSPPKEDIIYLL